MSYACRTQVTASLALGGILMERGQYAEAIGLWQDALTKNGALKLVRINMAMAIAAAICRAPSVLSPRQSS